jgi:hypothetical protein
MYIVMTNEISNYKIMNKIQLGCREITLLNQIGTELMYQVLVIAFYSRFFLETRP